MRDENEAADLHEERLDVVTRHLLESGARSVLDLGCGQGELIQRLLQEQQFQRIVGIDISAEALAIARDLLRIQHTRDTSRVSLCQASFAHGDDMLRGFDAAVMVETIEHVDPERLSAVENAVFACYQPNVVIVTTPNKEYNALYGMHSGRFRHPDHRFEWGRSKFRNWARGVASRNGYLVFFCDIGEPDAFLGSATQMAKFVAPSSMRGFHDNHF